MLSVVLLIIGTFIQYCTPIIKRTRDNIHTILYTYYQENYKDNIHTILYPYKSRELQTTFIQYCTPMIKRTTDNIHTILYTNNQENYRQHSYNSVQYCMNVVCSSLDYRCKYCMNVFCSSVDYRCTIWYECCL
jgi:hypothetical protein